MKPALQFDAGAEDREELREPGGMGRPCGAGDQVPVRYGFIHRDIGECAACRSYLRRNRRIATAFSALQPVRGRQYLRAMAKGRNGLFRVGEVPNDFQYTWVQANVFRSATTRNDERIITFGLDIIKSGIEREIVTALFGISLVAFKIVNGSAHHFAGLFAGTNRVNVVTYHQQRLKWNHYFVVFDVIADEHKNVFAGHVEPPEWTHRIAKSAKDS